MLGLDKLADVCHRLEDQLDAERPVESAKATLAATTYIRQWLAALAVGETPSGLPEPLLVEEPPMPVAKAPQPTAAAVDAPLPPDDTLESVERELVVEFATEAREHLEAVDGSLLVLESGDSPERAEAVNAVFRAFHTIKGLAGFMNLNILMSLAHEAESALDKVRSEEVPLTASMVNATFQMNDALKAQVASIEAALESGGNVPAPANYHQLIHAMAHAGDDEPVQTTSMAPALSTSIDSDADRPTTNAAASRTIKVDAARLDRLVDMIGELVIAEAMVSQCDELAMDEMVRMPGLLNQLDKTTRELQEMAMSLRMVPIRATFRRMARLARDVSHKLSKPVEFVTRGDDTELDKTVVDVIGDPLVHMVRNSIDHGIESEPGARERAGKPAKGRVELRAFHEGGCIHVEIEDDGRGLDREAILAKARSKGILEDDGEGMSDSEVYNLIFAPGFSTAAAVTEVSGRGVGLDVVKKNIEGLRGRVEIRSTPGKGSVFSIRLPLTLAIIDGMVVRAGRRRYIVPTLSIIRMFRPREHEVTTVLERGKLLRVGDALVPLHRLDQIFDLERSDADLDEMSALVVESSGGAFAFLVDELLGQHQIVIKPLGEAIGGVGGFAGGAIMPDGTVGLILDIAGLSALATKYGNTSPNELRQATNAV